VTFQLFDPKYWSRQMLWRGLQFISISCSVLAALLLLFLLLGHFGVSVLPQLQFDRWWAIVAFIIPMAWAGAGAVRKHDKRRRTELLSTDTSPWLKTTYDLPLLQPAPVDAAEAARRRTIGELVRQHYADSIRGPYFVRAVREPECGSQNFCICQLWPRSRYLFRFHRRIATIDDLRRLQIIEQGVAHSDVFGSYGRFLEPFRPVRPFIEGSYFVQHQSPDGDSELAAMYPFLEHVERFSGSEPELESLAELYGHLQTAIADQPWQELSSGRGWLEVDPSDLPDFLRSIGRLTHLGKDSASSSLWLLRKNSKLILDALERSLPLFVRLHSERTNQKQLLLHDLHPRNSFFRDGRCVLIYDYECVTRASTEGEAAAFALHRYARKMVIVQGWVHRSPAERNGYLRTLADLFLNSYNKGRGHPVLNVENFIKVLDSLIVLPNLQKLLYVGRSACFRTDDPGARSADVLHAELVKYVRCLEEAMEFRSNAASP
jgi:hypothetical protein